MWFNFILIICAIIFCVGYTNFRIKKLITAINNVLAQLQEQLLKVLNEGEGVFGEKFKSALSEAIHEGLEGLFDDPYEDIERLEDVTLFIVIKWEQKNSSVMFDFSEWDEETKKGLIGVTIESPFAQPENLKSLDEDGKQMPFMYPDATLRYVRNKNEEDGIPFWIWEEQPYFMMALQEGLDIEDDE